jgi:hypothetical protein
MAEGNQILSLARDVPVVVLLEHHAHPSETKRDVKLAFLLRLTFLKKAQLCPAAA